MLSNEASQKLFCLHMIHLEKTSIFKQLLLEEALLRDDDRSFVIINSGAPRAIVMGLSGQTEILLDLPKIQTDKIPIIQRFSGGGTVIIDEQTLFISFIFAKSLLDIAPFPESILKWSANLYKEAWNIPEFQLQENDYAIRDKKCAGNAQYIRKTRWLHHTSFLWDYQKEHMKYLLLPPKQPLYRKNRSHEEFLCRLADYGFTLENRIEQLKKMLAQRFSLKPCHPNDWHEKQPSRRSTKEVSY